MGFATSDPTIAERLYFLQEVAGRGFPALGSLARPARDQDARAGGMERHSANARRVAEYLDLHGAVEKALPGLPGHPGHEMRSAR